MNILQFSIKSDAMEVLKKSMKGIHVTNDLKKKCSYYHMFKDKNNWENDKYRQFRTRPSVTTSRVEEIDMSRV